MYKAWVTAVDDFVGDPTLVDNGYNPGYFHGFIPAFSKTDNFKVRGTPGVCLALGKFEDVRSEDPIGKLDPTDPFIVWGFTVTDPLGTQINGTIYTLPDIRPPLPCYLFNLTPGKYTISEPWDDYWVPTVNMVNGKYLSNPTRDITVRIGNKNVEVIFGNKHLVY